MVVVVAACSGVGGEPVATAAAPASPDPSSDPSVTAPVPTSTPASGAGVSTTTAGEITTTTLPELRSLRYQPVIETLSFPIVMTARRGSDVAWIGTKDGQVWTATAGELSDSPRLDLSARIRNHREQGLLGLALDPDDENLLYVHYSANDGDTVVSEIRLSDDGSFEERVLLQLDQPAANHNGGMIQLDADGHLYIALGDGGGADDRFRNGQNTATLLGAILRIDPTPAVSGAGSGDRPGYTVPDSNPFVDGGDQAGAGEIWAYGLRNPWRFWIDEVDGLVYIADVGQNAYEEVNVVALEPVGYDFGWPITEALHCFAPSSGCDVDSVTLPVVEVAHGDGGACSITGGVVYRGRAIPELEGHYLYSDYCGGWLRSLRWEGGVVDAADWTDQVGIPGPVVSFGVDGGGEVYVLTTESVFRIVAER